jgi:hypothetical protein
VAVDVGLVGRRHDHAVDARLEEPVGQELEHVGDVDRDGFGVRLDVFPLPFGRADLERRYGLSATELLVRKWDPRSKA